MPPKSKPNRRSDHRDTEVGRRVRTQRLTKGLSQTELGTKIGVTFQQVQKYENGGNRIGAGRPSRIAEALEVPASFFFPDESAAASPAPHQVRALQAALWSSISRRIMAIRDRALVIGGWCPSIVEEAP